MARKYYLDHTNRHKICCDSKFEPVSGLDVTEVNKKGYAESSYPSANVMDGPPVGFAEVEVEPEVAAKKEVAPKKKKSAAKKKKSK